MCVNKWKTFKKPNQCYIERFDYWIKDMLLKSEIKYVLDNIGNTRAAGVKEMPLKPL